MARIPHEPTPVPGRRRSRIRRSRGGSAAGHELVQNDAEDDEQDSDALAEGQRMEAAGAPDGRGDRDP